MIKIIIILINPAIIVETRWQWLHESKSEWSNLDGQFSTRDPPQIVIVHYHKNTPVVLI